MKAMVLAAGLGTRLKPITDSIPKALVPIHGIPMLSLLLDKLSAAGFSRIAVNVHAHADKMREYFASHAMHAALHIYYEEKILGTGGGIFHARDFFRDCDRFLVHNVDIVSSLDLSALMTRHGSDSIATLVVNRRRTSRPVFVDLEQCFRGKVEWFTDAPAASGRAAGWSEFGFCGIHVLTPRIFDYMNEATFDVFETYRVALDAGETIRCVDITGERWIDVGTDASLREVQDAMTLP